MSAPRSVLLCLAFLLVSALVLTEGLRMTTGPRKCCFEFVKRQIPRGQLVSYRNTSQQCLNEAVLFKTRRGQNLCAKPSDTWVQEYIKFFNAKNPGSQEAL